MADILGFVIGWGIIMYIILNMMGKFSKHSRVKVQNKDSSHPEKKDDKVVKMRRRLNKRSSISLATDPTRRVYETPVIDKAKTDDEFIYRQIADELAKHLKSRKLWTKAKEEVNGDEDKALSIYIKYRYQSIADKHESRK